MELDRMMFTRVDESAMQETRSPLRKLRELLEHAQPGETYEVDVTCFKNLRSAYNALYQSIERGRLPMEVHRRRNRIFVSITEADDEP